MKKLTIVSLSLLAASLVGTAAHAQTVIRITGSSAFRPAATAAIIDYLSNNGTVTVLGGYFAASTAFEPGILNAGVGIFANGTLSDGTTTGTATTIIETSFTGSLSGVVDLALGNKTAGYWDNTLPGTAGYLTAAQIDYINSNGTCTSIAGGSTAYGGGANLNGLSTTKPSASLAAVADMAFSDATANACGTVLASASLHLTSGVGITSASGTQYNSIKAIVTQVQGTAIAPAGSLTGDTGSGVGEGDGVGIVPFEWVVGNITTAAQAAPHSVVIPSNISQQVAKALMTNGYVFQSVFTGTNTTADSTNAFLLCGRSEDSGTRINGFADSQFGVATAPIQFLLAGANALYGAFTLPAANYPGGSLSTEPAIYWTRAGHGGQVSGSTVSNTMLYQEDGSQSGDAGGSETDFGIAYIGTSDAYYSLFPGASLGFPSTAPGAHLLSDNGVPFSVSAIQNGQYSYWNYEHAYVLSGNANQTTTVTQQAVNKIADLVYGNGAAGSSNPGLADISAIDGMHYQNSGGGGVASGILLDSNVHVQRTIEGGIITHL